MLKVLNFDLHRYINAVREERKQTSYKMNNTDDANLV